MTDTPALSRATAAGSGDTRTPARRTRPEREAPDMEAMVRRVIRSMARKATAGDLDSLESLANLEAAVREAIVDAGRGAHDGPGAYSYGEIARALGITRQSARERFG